MSKDFRRGSPAGPDRSEPGAERAPRHDGADTELGNGFVNDLARDHGSTASDSSSGVGSGPVADAWHSATQGSADSLPHQARVEGVFGVSLDEVEVYLGQEDAMGRIGGHAGQAGNQLVFAEDDPPFERVAEEVAHYLQGANAPATRTGDTSRTSDGAEVEAKHAATQAVSGTAMPLAATPTAGVHLDADDTAREARRRALEIKDAFFGGWFGEDEEKALAQIRGQSPLMIREIRAQYAQVNDGRNLESDYRSYCNSDQYTEALGLMWAALPLLDRLKTNVEPGWLWDSANEQGILDVLKSSSRADLDAAASDARVMQILRDNLNDDEMFEARKLLTPDAMYELVVQRIRDSNNWFNDDENAVYSAVIELPADQRRRLWDEHHGDLFDFLSSSEKTAVRRMLLGSDAEAYDERMRLATEGLGTDDDAVAMVAEKVQGAAQEEQAIVAALETGQTPDGQPLTVEQVAALETRRVELGGVSDLLQGERDADGDLRGDSFLGRLHGDVGTDEFQAFTQQMGASSFDRAKQQILDAVGFFNDDEQAIYDAFDSVVAEVDVPQGTDAEAARALQERANQTLRRQLWNDPQVLEALSHLNLSEQSKAATYRDGDSYDIAVDRLTDAYEGWNTDEEGIFRLIVDMAPEDRRRFLDDEPPLYARMRSTMSTEEFQLVEAALRDGRLPPDKALDYAMGGNWDGTREDLIVETLDGLSNDERYVYRLGYWLHSTGNAPADDVQKGALDRFTELYERMQGELGDDDLQRAMDAMIGPPTPQELETEQGRIMAADLLRERMQDKQEVSGGIANWFTETDETKDMASARLEAQYQLSMQDGLLTADELAMLAALDQTYQDRYAENEAAVDMVAGIASTVAAIAAGIVVTVLTGGTAGPAVAGFLAQYGAAAAIGGVAGAVAKVGTSELMAGDHYDTMSTEGLRDAAIGFTDGAMTVLSAGLASRFTQMIGLSRGALAAEMSAGVVQSSKGAIQYAGQAALRTGVQGTIEGFMAGAVGEMVMTASDEATWRRSVWGVITEMGVSLIRGGGIGAATGFVTGSAMDAIGGFVEARRVPGLVQGLEDAGLDGDRLRRMSIRHLEDIGRVDAAMAAGKLDEADEALQSLHTVMDPGEMARVRRSLAHQHGIDLPNSSAEGRVADLAQQGAFDSSGYHGTSSAALDGLDQTDGVIYSADELQRRSVQQTTGEGDAFSGSSGRKTFISIGVGESGLGTSAAYADAAQNLHHYNVQRYTYDELTEEINRLNTIVDHFDDIDVQVARDNMIGAIATREKGQFASQLEKLEAEKALRDMLPEGHARRIGGEGNSEAYPILFEFDMDNLAHTTRNGVKDGDVLGGEGSAQEAIDLAQRVKRAYAPQENLAEFQARLETMLGHSNFEVLPLESLSALPTGNATGSRQATFDHLGRLQRSFVEVQKMYEQAVASGESIDIDKAMEILQKSGW